MSGFGPQMLLSFTSFGFLICASEQKKRKKKDDKNRQLFPAGKKQEVEEINTWGRKKTHSNERQGKAVKKKGQDKRRQEEVV